MVLKFFEDVLLLGYDSFGLDDSHCHSRVFGLDSFELVLTDVMG